MTGDVTREQIDALREWLRLEPTYTEAAEHADTILALIAAHGEVADARAEAAGLAARCAKLEARLVVDPGHPDACPTCEGYGRIKDGCVQVATYQLPPAKNRRRGVWSRTKGRCQLCGTENGKRDVHHNNYDCLGFEQPHDVTLLCEKCHKRHHGKGGKEVFPV